MSDRPTPRSLRSDIVHVERERGAPNGLASLNARRRMPHGVDATDDLIVDDPALGLVLKSPNNHYWRATISNAGSVTWTDLGTATP